MNAIIALCHFCEEHGPRVMFCTQPFSDETNTLEDSPSLNGDRIESSNIENKSNRSFSVYSDTTTSSIKSILRPSTQRANSVDLCDACRSLSPHTPGIISRDQEAKVSYTSSQHPVDRNAFAKVRGACLRSLSCEVCPGREGPIFFGDAAMGHVLSYTFFIKDAQARGLRRWYSIIVLMMDRTYLLHSYTFLVRHVREIVEMLQVKADSVYQAEHSVSSASSLLSSGATATSGMMAKQSPGCAVQRRQFSTRLQRGRISARPVVVLTSDPDLFKTLHMRFTWILKAASGRFTEKILEGSPTEDSAISLEIKDDSDEDDSLQDADNETLSGASSGRCAEEEEDSLVFENLRELYRTMGYTIFHSVAYHVVIGNQIILRCKSKKLIRSIFDCLKVLLPRGCCKIIYYSESYEPTYKCSFLGLPLSVDLPSHCGETEEQFLVVDVHLPSSIPTHSHSEENIESAQSQSCGESPTFEQSQHQWETPEAGQSQCGPETPKSGQVSHGEEGHGMVLDVSGVGTRLGNVSLQEACDLAAERSESVTTPTNSVNWFHGYEVRFHCKKDVPAKGPVVLEKMEMAITNQNLRWSVVERCLTCLKEEWINKVKMVFMFTKAGGNRSREDTHRLLSTFGAEAEDKKVLKFWMTGLSRQYKNYMLSTSIQHSFLSI